MKFSDLRVGDLFEDGSDLYLKLHAFEASFPGPGNAINVWSGLPACFFPNYPVEPPLGFVPVKLANREGDGCQVVRIDAETLASIRYALALHLVAGIDRHLRRGTRHYYDTQGKRLIHLGEVVNAILSNTLQPTQKGEKDQ
jgi:hypothetical protein